MRLTKGFSMTKHNTRCKTPKSMTATLTFTLPEETIEHHAAVHGLAYRAALSMIREHLRQRLKHGHQFGSADDALLWVQALVVEACNDATSPPE